MSNDTFTAKAAADLSAVQYHLVRWSAAGFINLSSLDTTDQGCGVLQTVTKSGQPAAVADAGNGYVIAGAAVTANDLFTCNGSGRAVTAGSADLIYGRALEAATADGDKIRARYFTPRKNL